MGKRKQKKPGAPKATVGDVPMVTFGGPKFTVEARAPYLVGDAPPQHQPKIVVRVSEPLQKRRGAGKPKTLEKLRDALGTESELIESSLRPLIEQFRAFLAEFTGWVGESFEENQEAAQLIQATAHRLGCLFVCTKEGCGRPGVFRCAKPERSKNGHFQFDHVDEPRTVHGAGATIPALNPVRKKF